MSDVFIRYVLTPVDRGSRTVIARDTAVRNSVKQTNQALLAGTRVSQTAARAAVQGATVTASAHRRAASSAMSTVAPLRRAESAHRGVQRAAQSESLAVRNSARAHAAGATVARNLSGALNRLGSSYTSVAVKAREAAREQAANARSQAGSITGVSRLGILGGAAGAAGGARFGLAGAGAGAAVGIGFAAAIKSAASFEQQMDRVNAVSGASSSQMRQLGAAARKYGAETEFSNKQAAEAMYSLSTAGFTVDETLKTLPGTLALAAAGGVDLGRAAEVQAAALRQFGLNASESGRVADVLAKTTNSSAVEIEDLAEAMTYVGPVAKSSNQSLEDMAAAIGLLGNSGIRGSMAGTALRRAIINLQAPTAKMKDSLTDLGVSAQDLYGPKGLKPLPEIIGEIVKGAQGMSAQRRNANLAKLFGSEALPGVITLVEKGEAAYRRQSKALEDSRGAAEKTAAIMRNNAAGAFEAFTGSVETAATTLGTVFLPALTKALRGAAGGVNRGGDSGLAFLEGLTGKAEAGRKITAGPGGIPAGRTGPRAARTRIAIQNPGQGPPQRERVPLNPVREELTGMAKAGNAVRETVLAVAPVVTRALSKAFAAVKTYAGDMIEALRPAVPFFQNVLLPILTGVARGILGGLVVAFKVLLGVVRFVAPILGSLGRALAPLKPVFAAIGTVIGAVFGGAILRAIGFIVRLLPVVRTLSPVLNGMVRVFNGVFGAIGAVIGRALRVVGSGIKGIVAVFRGGGGVIGSAVRGIVSVIARVLGGIGRVVTAPFRLAWNAARSIISSAAPRISRGVRQLILEIRVIVATIRETIGRPFRSAFGAIAGIIRGVAGRVGDAARGIRERIVGAFRGMTGVVRGLVSGLAGVFTTVLNAVIAVFNRGIGALNSATPGRIRVAGETIFPGVPDIPTIPTLQGGGTASGLARVSSGELLVYPNGASGIVPGPRVAADNVLASLPHGTAVITGHGQGILAAGGSLSDALAHQLPHFARGGVVRGKVSVFGPPLEKAGTTALGVSSSNQGVAIRPGATFQSGRPTLGDYWRVTIGSRSTVLRQTDLGPHEHTGRRIDLTGAGSIKMGINPSRFPTDKIGAAVHLGRTASTTDEGGIGAKGPGATRKPRKEEAAEDRTRSILNIGALSRTQTRRKMAEFLTGFGDTSPFGAGYQAGLERQSLAGRPGRDSALLRLALDSAVVPTRELTIPGAEPDAAGGRGSSGGIGDINIRGAGGGRGALGRIVSVANRIDQARYPYQWGGGHGMAPPSPSMGSPGGPHRGTRPGYDCSGAIGRLVNEAKIPGSPRAAMHSSQYANAFVRGPGKNFTIHSTGSHVWATIGNRGWGTSNSNPAGGAGWHSRRPGGNLSHPRGMRAGGVFGRSPGFGTGGRTGRGGRTDEFAITTVARDKGGTSRGARPYRSAGEIPRHEFTMAIGPLTRYGILPGFRKGGYSGGVGAITPGVTGRNPAGTDFQVRPLAPRELIAPIMRVATRDEGRAALRLRELAEAIDNATTIAYGTLSRTAAGIRRQIRILARGGLTAKERIGVNRLRAALTLVEGEMGRRTGLLVAGVQRQAETLERDKTRLSLNLRIGGVDEASAAGITAMKDFAAAQVVQLEKMRGGLSTALRRATRAGDTETATAIQTQLNDMDTAILGARADVADAGRALAELAKQQIQEQRDALVEATGAGLQATAQNRERERTALSQGFQQGDIDEAGQQGQNALAAILARQASEMRAEASALEGTYNEVRRLGGDGQDIRSQIDALNAEAATAVTESIVAARNAMRVGITEQIDALTQSQDRARTRMSQQFVRAGVDESSEAGQAALAAILNNQAAELRETVARITAQAGNDSQVRGQIESLNETLEQVITDQIVAARQALRAASEEQLAAISHSASLTDIELQSLETQQRIAGTFDSDTAKVERRRFIEERIVPQMRRQLEALQNAEQVAVSTGDIQGARQAAEQVAQQRLAMDQKQLEVLDMIRENTAPLKDIQGTAAFSERGQLFTDRLEGVGFGT